MPRPPSIRASSTTTNNNRRRFWDQSAGNCTDQGAHLMDVIEWFLCAGTPRSTVCHGDVYAMTGAQKPDVFSAAFERPGFMATGTLDYGDAFDNGWNVQFLGRTASLWLDNGGANPLAPAGKPTTRGA